MFDYCNECTQEFAGSSSWLTPLVQLASAGIAAWALYVAKVNLNGVRRSQILQAQINLINIENEVRKNGALYKATLLQYSQVSAEFAKKNPNLAIADFTKISELDDKKISTFEAWVSSADKLAALINADFLRSQFPGREWKKEYGSFFSKIKRDHKNELGLIEDKNNMVRNIEKLLISMSESNAPIPEGLLQRCCYSLSRSLLKMSQRLEIKQSPSQ
jgi:hypothetical protein